MIDGELESQEMACPIMFIYSPIYGLPACSGRVGVGGRSGRSSGKMAGWQLVAVGELTPDGGDDGEVIYKM